MDESVKPFESQFSAENITALKNHINKSINEYAETGDSPKKLDLFLVAAALEQSTYELLMRSLAEDADHAKTLSEEMKTVSMTILGKLDENRKENKTVAAAEMLALVHSTSIVCEFYARQRDSFLNRLQDTAKTILNETDSEDTTAE